MSSKPNRINFVRISIDDYHRFSLIHYISIKSFADNNPGIKIYVFLNKLPTDCIWWTQLTNDVDLTSCLVNTDNIAKFDRVEHCVDQLRLEIQLRYGGLYVDMDFICLKPLDFMFSTDNCITGLETDPLSHKMSQICNAFTSNIPNDQFISDCLDVYADYHKGMDWTHYFGALPTKIYNDKYKDIVQLLPEKLIEPFTYTRDALSDIFLHNRLMTNAVSFHVSESLSWDMYLKRLDLEHIMTVDTTFTKAVRRYVSHLWDKETNRPTDNYYE
jgi:hypothetical protein